MFKKIAIVLVGLAVVTLIAFLIWFNGDPQGNQPHLAEGSPVVGAVGNVINLEHGWALDTQQAYYFTDQGSRILPYSWFLNLEQVSNQNLFRSDDNINGYRFLPATSTEWNPDALPVGLVKNIGDGTNLASVGEEWLGFTCAACHTTQLSYNGTNIRIDGGPTLANLEKFVNDMVDVMQATHDDGAKFDRFATAVFSAGYSPNDKDLLRAELNTQTILLRERNCRNHPLPTPACPASFASEIPVIEQARYGYGRIDALGAIINQVFGDFAMATVPNNAHPADAPVSFPFLWGTHQSDVVQWPGNAPNLLKFLSFGTILRNAGEVMGVYGQIVISENTSTDAFASSLNILDLGELEMWVGILRSPRWPSDPDILPAIDTASAGRGEGYYETYCVACHQVIARADEGKPYNVCMTPVTPGLNTDPRELNNLMDHVFVAGRFEGRKILGVGPQITGTTTAGTPLGITTLGGLLEQPRKAFEAAVFASRGGEESGTVAGLTTADDLAQEYSTVLTSPPAPSSTSASCQPGGVSDAYKARPLNGIWATSPYLHNGSVPNLYELLLPPDQRSKTFFLGRREFDPVKVGFVVTPDSSDSSLIEFDTTRIGNSNKGHEYGVNELDDTQRMDLVEFIKTLGR